MIDACVIETVPGGFAEVNKFAKECCLVEAGRSRVAQEA